MFDEKIFDAIENEEYRQREGLELIPSENYVSREVLAALGSVLTNILKAILEEGIMGVRKIQILLNL